MMPVALSLLVSLPSWSADFDKVLAAYKRVDYATAIREWRPLAEQEHACAQFNLGVVYEKGARALFRITGRRRNGTAGLLDTDMPWRRII